MQPVAGPGEIVGTPGEGVGGRVEGWLRDGSVHRHHAEARRRVFSFRPEEIFRYLVDPGEVER